MKIYLETERIVLREFEPGDEHLLFDLDIDPEVMRYINGGIPSKPSDMENLRKKTIPNLLKYHERGDGYGFWIALEKPSNTFIGWFHLRPAYDDGSLIELGYRMKRMAWGKGYGTEVSKALVKKGFEDLGVDVIVAIAMPGNEGSINIMKKCGMTFEKEYMYNGETKVERYRITRETYEKIIAETK